jgi:flagellar motility protein MotE (MotC chaperone)
MSSRVRLLPALIGAAGVLFTLRLGAMASGAENAPADTNAAAEQSAVADAAGSPAPPSGANAQKVGEAATHAPSPTTAGPATAGSASAHPPPPVNQAQTKGEAEVLQNLGLRRVALDGRERDLALREQLMSATEKRVSEHLVELKALEAKLGSMLAERDAAEEAQLTSLVKTYENMKPADAAKIFNKLDRQVMLSLAQRMKPAKIGGIMAAMEPARAQDLTVMLALRLHMPKPQQVIPAVPAPVSAPPEEQPRAAASPPEPPHS